FDICTKPKTETTKNFVQTIVREEIPPSIYQLIDSKGYAGRVFMFKFIGSNSGKPVISQMAKQFDIDVNVLFGNIIELQGTPFGHLVVELEGRVEDIEQAL